MIGERVKQVRKGKGLSQKDFASILNTSQGYVSDIENETKKPGAELLISLKRLFHVDLNWLLTGEEPMIAEMPEAPVDAELLEAAIEFSEELLESLGKEATAKQKTQLILALYDLAKERDDHKIDRPTALRLVKLMAA